MNATAATRVADDHVLPPAYLRRPTLWADRHMTVKGVRELIATLDPVTDCAAITHLSLEVATPSFFSQMVYLAGAIRGLSHRGEAAVGYRGGKGDQLRDPDGRDRDTLTFFGLLYKYGPESAEVRAVVDRIQQIHHDVKGVSVELQLHILALMMVEQERWVRDLGQPDWFSATENQARFHLWSQIGTLMGLPTIWSSYEEVEPWVVAWEAENVEPTFEAQQLFHRGTGGFERWFPLPGRLRTAAAKQVMTVGLGEQTRDVVAAPKVVPGLEFTMRRFLDVAKAIEPVRRVNLSHTWVSRFSRIGDEPDLASLGYQHDVAGDGRYLRKGDPKDGYRYTVERGVESLAATAEE